MVLSYQKPIFKMLPKLFVNELASAFSQKISLIENKRYSI